jgi:predicted RNase H-like HicB family nuclease
MNTYTAIARRSGDWWAITVPELKGVHTQVKRLDRAAIVAREAIALFLDVPISSISVNLRPDVPPVVTAALRAREKADEAEDSAAAATRLAARRLIADGMTVREVAQLLKLSPQRISQIARVSAPTDFAGVPTPNGPHPSETFPKERKS